MKYGVVIENAGGNLSAYLPDVQGVVVTGATVGVIIERMQIAVEWHIEGLIEDGQPIPLPSQAQKFEAFVDVQLPERFNGIQFASPESEGARELLLA